MTMRPVYYTFTPAAENTNTIANDAAALAGAAFPLSVDQTSDGLAHKLIITPSGSVTGNYTVSGIDADGQAVTETLATSTTNPVTTANFYKDNIVVLAPSGIGANTVDIGWVDEFASQTIPMEIFNVSFASITAKLSGTANFDIEVTNSDIRASYSPPPSQTDYTWLNDANFTNKSATLTANLATHARAIRLVVNSYSTGAVLGLEIVTPR